VIVSCHYPFCAVLVRSGNAEHYEKLTEEEKRMMTDSCQKRREEFAAGRHAAKTAVRKLSGHSFSGDAVTIRYGEHGEPTAGDDISLSISHDSGLAAAVCNFMEAGASGIDIHSISHEAFEIRESWLDGAEIAVLDCFDDTDISYSLAWCAKESASKVLLRGLAAISDIRIIDIVREQNDVYVDMLYQNEVYRAFVMRFGASLLSLCLEKSRAVTYENTIKSIMYDFQEGGL